LKYGPSRARPQQGVAVPGWGFDVKMLVMIKRNSGTIKTKKRSWFTEKRQNSYLLV
jgi:hypothetical protein